MLLREALSGTAFAHVSQVAGRRDGVPVSLSGREPELHVLGEDSTEERTTKGRDRRFDGTE
jgi:hypothetical protein